MPETRVKKIISGVFIVIITIILILGIIDVMNLDDRFHSFIYFLLRQKKQFYFDLPFVQTTLNLFEILGLLLAVFASFYILRKEQKHIKERTKLAYKPFIKPSTTIVFGSFTDNLGILMKNIGGGSALFVRVSFVESDPDNSENAILRSDQPHSEYLGSNEKSGEIFFDPRSFYKFITGTERGGELGSDRTNYNNQAFRKEQNNLIKAKVNQDFYIYIHLVDILGNPMTFKVRYLLRLEDDCGGNLKFMLKRMEVREI